MAETLSSPDDKRLFLLLLKLGLNEEEAYSFVQELQTMASANLIAQFQGAMESKLDATNARLDTQSASLNSRLDAQNATLDSKLDAQNSKIRILLQDSDPVVGCQYGRYSHQRSDHPHFLSGLGGHSRKYSAKFFASRTS